MINSRAGRPRHQKIVNQPIKRFAASSKLSFLHSLGQFRKFRFDIDEGVFAVIQAPKREPRIMRYELSDHEWDVIKPMLPNKPRGAARVNDWRVLNGVFWILRSGAPWRDLPESYGPATTALSVGEGGCFGLDHGSAGSRSRCVRQLRCVIASNRTIASVSRYRGCSMFPLGRGTS